MTRFREMSSPEQLLGIGMLLLTLAGFVCLLLKGAQLKRLRSGMRRPRALAQRAWHQIDAWSWCGVVLLLTGGEVIRQWRGGAVMESLPSGGGWWMLPQLLIQAVIAGGVLTVGLARCGSWRRAFGRIIPRGDFKAAVLTLLALLPVALVLMPYWSHLLVKLGVEVEPQAVVQMVRSADSSLMLKVYLVFLAVVVAPLSEELVFRGVLLPVALRHMRPWLAIAFVSAIFAFVHAHFATFPPLFLLSVGLCVVHLLTGRVSSCICMHGLFNALSVVAMFTMDQVTEAPV